MTVVPMPKCSGFSRASLTTAMFAAWIASTRPSTRVVSLEALPHEVDRDRGGDLAGRVPAHAVGDDGQRVVDVDRVLIRSDVPVRCRSPRRDANASTNDLEKNAADLDNVAALDRCTRPFTSSWFT